MSLTPADLLPDFRQEFQELNGKSNDDVTRALDLALMVHNVRAKAVLYLAAHFLATAQGRIDAAGNIVTDGGGLIKTGEGMAGQTVRFENPDATQRSAILSGTSYGRQFLILERGSVAAFGARVYG